jgi:hypothetical protein
VLRKTIPAICATLLATALCGAQAAGAVAISQHDGLTWADVASGGQVLHFVVDTGATVSCVNLAAARRLGLPLGAPEQVAAVGGGTIAYRCAGFIASAGGMALPSEVLVLDLSGPARACSQPIDGLIGADFFRGKTVRIDFANGRLTRVDRLSAGAGIPLRFANGALCAPVAVDGGAPLWTRIDTGCTDALDWCGAAGSRARGPGRSVALAASRRQSMLADVNVGATLLRDLPVKTRSRAIFPGEAGLLGNAALSRYRITIDGITRRLLLE